MTDIIKGKCPDCFMNGASLDSLGKLKKLVDGVRCGPCHRIAIKEGRIPKPPHKPREKKPPTPRPKSPSYLKRRAEEEALSQAIAGLDKGTHFLSLAAEALGWPLDFTRHVYGRLYDRGLRRQKVIGGNVLALLKESPRTFQQLKKLTGMSDSGVSVALKKLGDRVVVTRNGRSRLYTLSDEGFYLEL